MVFIYSNSEYDGSTQPFHVDVRGFDTEKEADEKYQSMERELSSRYDIVNSGRAAFRMQSFENTPKAYKEARDSLREDTGFVVQFKAKEQRRHDYQDYESMKSKGVWSSGIDAEFHEQQVDFSSIAGHLTLDEDYPMIIFNAADPNEIKLCSIDREDEYAPYYYTLVITEEDGHVTFDENDPVSMNAYKESRRLQLFYKFYYDVRELGLPLAKKVDVPEYLAAAYRIPDGTLNPETAEDLSGLIWIAYFNNGNFSYRIVDKADLGDYFEPEDMLD